MCVSNRLVTDAKTENDDSLRPKPEHLQAEAVWAIGNIAGDSIQHRDLCIENDGMSAVLHVPLPVSVPVRDLFC